MKSLILMIAVFLYVDKPVASLQFDMDTSGAITLDSSVPKQIATGTVDGKLRVIIYGLDQSTFTGKFAAVSQHVTSITNVIGADQSGSAVAVRVTTLSKPVDVRVTKKP